MDLDYIKGRTHGPEYSWHKYWSRKPANVIRAYLSNLVPNSGLVVDPFSGSGVVLHEAGRLGFDCLAFDVNPIAVEISRFMITTLNRTTFVLRAQEILDKVVSELGNLYQHNGKQIRFLVHHVVNKCKSCDEENIYYKETYGSSGKRCSKCDATISFGLSQFSRTIITEIHYVDGSSSSSNSDLTRQQETSSRCDLSQFVFDLPFVDNRRTLTSSSVSTRSYYTGRNFWILSKVAELAHSIADERLRSALLLMVTGSSAQASRLIASRGKLSGGGQAWTIPGFWVPPIHLESNPFIHLRARIKKMDEALKTIHLHGASNGRVQQKSAKAGLSELGNSSKKADLIFLDPPYGDSVAFIEFSALWNSFLKAPVNYAEDISVSDRQQTPMTMEVYAQSLLEIASLAHTALKDEGKILLTFNNNDLNAWKAIVQSLQTVGFEALHVNYQEPAVISTKSQKSLAGSYIGDFYVVFVKSKDILKSFQIHREDLARLLSNAASSRGNTISVGLALRFALNFWLVKNIDAREINYLNDLISELFYTKSGVLTLKSPNDQVKRIDEMVLKLAEGLVLTDSADFEKFITLIKKELSGYGCPTPSEAFDMAQLAASEAQLW